MDTVRYPSYRDSGLPWVPEIPEGWQVLRNGRLFAHRVQTGFPDLPILEVSLRTGVRVRDMENLKRKQVMSQKEKYKRAAKGDIAYNMMRMWQGALGAAPVDGLVSPAYVVASPFPEANSAYFSYLFRTAAYMREVNKFSRGIVSDRNRLYWDEFKQMPSLLPPRAEQDQIVAYLRVQDAHIARFIKAKRELINLLNEQKLRIIDHAVTRGLDASVALKPSGIEWLGDVPEHWQVNRLKTLCAMKSGDGITSFSIDETGEYPVYGGNGIRGYTSGFTHDGEFILIGRQGALCGNVHHVSGRFWPSEHAVVVTVRPQHDIQWLRKLLSAMNLNQYSISAAQPGLSVERLLNLYAPVPPLDEQGYIANTIELETQDIEIAISRTNHEISLILEYRDRLIADVVTGQIDVRDWLPGPDDEVADEALAALGGDEDIEADGEDEDGEE